MRVAEREEVPTNESHVAGVCIREKIGKERNRDTVRRRSKKKGIEE
jgi:hypothetical protein